MQRRPRSNRIVSLLILAVACASWPEAATAFSVELHGDVARRAWMAEAALRGEMECSAACRAFTNGAAHEDINTPTVKWLRFHHYHRPDRMIQTTFREGPEVRMWELWQDALSAARAGDLTGAWERAGHVAHFIADVGSPPHVVPVAHGLSDSFEKTASREIIGDEQFSRLEGNATLEVASPVDALDGHATHTLAVVNDPSGGVACADGRRVPWSAFWAESNDGDGWGGYGEAGNTFGTDSFEFQGQPCVVEPEQWLAFVTARTDDAIGWTRAFLRWAAPQFAHPRPPETSWRTPPLLFVTPFAAGMFGPESLRAGLGLRFGFSVPRGFGVEASLARLAGQPHTWTFAGTWVLVGRRLGWPVHADLMMTLGGGRQAFEPGLAWGAQTGLGLRLFYGPWLQARVDATGGLFATDSGWRPTLVVTAGLGVNWGDP